MRAPTRGTQWTSSHDFRLSSMKQDHQVETLNAQVETLNSEVRRLIDQMQIVLETAGARMQNRYVGDVGDFAKYALLRRLAGTSPEQSIRLGMMIYIRTRATMPMDDISPTLVVRGLSPLDLDLISALQEIVGSNRRSIAAIANAAILPQETIFCDALACLLPSAPSIRRDRLLYRSGWLEDCLTARRRRTHFLRSRQRN